MGNHTEITYRTDFSEKVQNILSPQAKIDNEIEAATYMMNNARVRSQVETIHEAENSEDLQGMQKQELLPL